VGYCSTNKTVYSAEYPIVWCPKFRRRVLAGRVEVRLKQIIARVVDEAGGEVIEVMPDHGRLLAEVPPMMALSGLVQPLKGRWSRRWRSECPALRRAAVWWSPSWLVSAVGGAALDVVRRYVENQTMAA
jgi:putative transposase